MISDALTALQELERTNSRLAKLEILKEHRYDRYLHVLLERAYNPFRLYWIKKLDQEVINTSWPGLEVNFENFLNLLRDLSSRTVTGNEALTRVVSVFETFSKLEAKWYWRVLVKDLNIGIQAKTINEAIPGLIPVFEVSLAQPFREFPPWFVLQPKIDGMRIIADTTTGNLFSRKGKPVEGFDDLSREIKQGLPGGYILDGEILAGAKGKKVHTFNTLMTQAFRKSQGKQGILSVFDIVTQKEFELNQSKLPLLDRLNLLSEILVPIGSKLILPVETSKPIKLQNFDSAFINKYYEKFLDEGYEGMMVKEADSAYSYKRSYSWQKIKPINTYDLKVVDVEPGNPGTKYEEQVGRLVCDFNGVEVRVGTGLTDHQRGVWWADKGSIIGSTIEVEAQETTTNKQGTTSLRFPRFKRVRTDK